VAVQWRLRFGCIGAFVTGSRRGLTPHRTGPPTAAGEFEIVGRHGSRYRRVYWRQLKEALSSSGSRRAIPWNRREWVGWEARCARRTRTQGLRAWPRMERHVAPPAIAESRGHGGGSSAQPDYRAVSASWRAPRGRAQRRAAQPLIAPDPLRGPVNSKSLGSGCYGIAHVTVITRARGWFAGGARESSTRIGESEAAMPLQTPHVQRAPGSALVACARAPRAMAVSALLGRTSAGRSKPLACGCARHNRCPSPHGRLTRSSSVNAGRSARPTA
jgi:hypothetical protein